MPIQKVTVLMTVYNGGNFLKKSIESVLAQTFDQFEFVIVDDCSRDGSVALIKSYADRRIVLYENEVNRGQTKSLNIGLNKARGKYIARMDADDIALPHWLEKVYYFIEKNSAYCVVSPRALIINEHSRIKQCTGLPLAEPEIILKNIMESSLNHVGALMRKDDIIKVGGYDDNFVIAADYDLWTRLLIAGYRLINIDEILTAIRIHNVSISTQGKNKRDAEVVDIMQKNIRHFTDSSLTQDETRILWNILHDIKNYTDEAAGVDKLINSVYNNIKPQFGWSKSLVQEIKVKKQRQIFKKRILMLLKNCLSPFPLLVKGIEAAHRSAVSLSTRVRFRKATKTLNGLADTKKQLGKKYAVI